MGRRNPGALTSSCPTASWVGCTNAPRSRMEIWATSPRASQHADDAYAAFVLAGTSRGSPMHFASEETPLLQRTILRRRERSISELAVHAERIGDSWNGAIALNNLGDLALQAGDWATAVALCNRSSEIRTELGDRWGSALALANVAVAKLQLGELEDAAETLRRALCESLAVGPHDRRDVCRHRDLRRVRPRAHHDVAVLVGAANRSTSSSVQSRWLRAIHVSARRREESSRSRRRCLHCGRCPRHSDVPRRCRERCTARSREAVMLRDEGSPSGVLNRRTRNSERYEPDHPRAYATNTRLDDLQLCPASTRPENPSDRATLQSRV